MEESRSAGRATRDDMLILGWDVGGVNVKIAAVRGGVVVHACTAPFEIQRAPRALVPLLRRMADAALAGARHEVAACHAVTMTAELSQMFRTKREGVAFVIDALAEAFPGAAVHVFTVVGRFLAPAAAREAPLDAAAANWAATARVVAASHPDAVLVDIGTTTTDIVPIVAGAVAATGRTDPERLAAGELVYAGVVRTPVEAIVRTVPWMGRETGVSAEGFALTGDVHVWRGDLAPSDYTTPTPDGRPATRVFAGERLARIICADREMLDDRAVDTLAEAVATAQCQFVAAAIDRVRRRHPAIAQAVVTGAGAFLGERAARLAGLTPVRLAALAEAAAAASVALLLERAQRPVADTG